MRYAVLSDVHGNLEALSAVLADAAAEGALGILCLGDVVGYGADPNACVEILGERAASDRRGQSRARRAGTSEPDWFNSAARAAALWTRDQLGPHHAEYLSRLGLQATLGEATCVHASPRRPEEWDYLISEEDGYGAFGDFETRVCFVGHSHRPAVWSLGSGDPITRISPAPPVMAARSASTMGDATSSTWEAWASRATGIPGPPTSCGTRTRSG